MTDLCKAAEMALEALEQTPTANKLFDPESYEKQKDAIDALRQALAQAEQERRWVGITYDEVYEFVCTTDSYINLARAIEAKLKEKNGG